LRIDDRTSRGATLIPILITTLTHFVLGGRLGTNFSVPPDKAIAIDQITVRDGKLQKDRVTMLAGHGQAAADRTPETSLATPGQDLTWASTRCVYRMLRPENIPTVSGASDTCSRPPICRLIPVQESSDVTTWMNPSSSERSRRPPGRPV
jgi:hypothetical protein